MKIYSAQQFKKMKNKKAIAMLTAYTYPVAKHLENAGICILLVGDSVGMVEMGFTNTTYITLDHMQYHIQAVRRGAPNTHIIGDMPFESYQNPKQALSSAKALLKAGANSVKLEGACCEEIAYLVKHGIDVVGHTGLTPQTAKSYKQVGRSQTEFQEIFQQAINIVEAGCFMLVLEHMPDRLAKQITQTVDVPTIGIGAGSSCNGQVAVINDVLGLGTKWPPFSKQYSYFGNQIEHIAKQFKKDVSHITP